MSRVPDSVSHAAEARADALRARVRARLAQLLPGVTIRAAGDRIDLSGRGLLNRWVRTAALRDWREGEP